MASMTKIPLTQHAIGVATTNGTIDSRQIAFLLETTMAGVAYRCDCNPANDYCGDAPSPSEDVCPQYCSSKKDFMFDLIDMNNFVTADPITSKLTIGDLSISKFRAARVCDYYSDDLFKYDVNKVANGVLGLGPGPFKPYPAVERELDSLPWSKFSIYLTDSVTETGSFLLGGGVDTDLITAKGLKEIVVPAITDNGGWTVQMALFLTNDTPLNSASCDSKWSPCYVGISASSPVIQLQYGVWKDFEEAIPWDKYDCRTNTFAGEYVYICNDDVVLPRLGFRFGDQTIYVDQEHYTLPHPEYPNRVAVMLQTSSKYEFSWYLGTPFLRAIYTSFDKDAQTISFYCKEGVNCGKNGKTKPSEWEETVDTSIDEIKNFRKAGFGFAILSVVFFVVVIAFAKFKLNKMKRTALEATGEGEADEKAKTQASEETTEVYEEVTTPTAAQPPVPAPRESVFV